MSTPIIEYIAEHIKDSINEITEANGFNETVSAKRPTAVDYHNAAWDDLSAVIAQVNSTDEEGPLNIATRRQHFEIVVFALNSESSDTTIDTRLNQIFADIEKKLMEDPTRNTYALDTQVHSAAFFRDDSGGITGVEVDVSVLYRTVLINPYMKG